MHEMSIVQSMMEIILQQAEIHNARKIVKINLEFGFLTAVVPESIEFAFEILAKDGIAEGAELNVKIIPIKVRCMECLKEKVIEKYDPLCPFCSSASLQIVEGRDEMRIASLEVDD